MPAPEPTLFLFMGLIASGKSTLARLWAEHHGLASFNSDVIRKELAGRQHGTGTDFGSGIYTPEFSRRTYDELLRRAAHELGQGRSVVLDASYHRRAERQRVLDLCGEHGWAFCFILCFCSREQTRQRLARRAKDPHAVSDGTWDIFVKQEKVFEYPEELSPAHFISLETSHPPDQLLIQLQGLFD